MERSLDKLRKELLDAQQAHHAVLVRGRTARVPLTDYSAAHERVLQAEREVAAATGDQYATPLDLGFVPEAGVSAPALLQSDFSAVLTFTAVTMAPDGSRTKAGTAVIEFDRCHWTSFGYPNDEALPGHPLHDAVCLRHHAVRRMVPQEVRVGSADMKTHRSLKAAPEASRQVERRSLSVSSTRLQHPYNCGDGVPFQAVVHVDKRPLLRPC